MSANIRECLPVQTRNELFKPYIRKSVSPPLNPEELRMDILTGPERKKLTTPTTGTSTLAISYKNKEGAVASVNDTNEDLIVLQLQGARTKKSYRLTTGLNWVIFFADQIDAIAAHPLSSFTRLILPVPHAIEGVMEELARKREVILERYLAFAAAAHLSLSVEEQAYIKDIAKK